MNRHPDEAPKPGDRPTKAPDHTPRSRGHRGPGPRTALRRRRRPTAPRRLSLRGRLTLLYGVLFLIAGLLLLGLTQVLFDQQTEGSGPKILTGGAEPARSAASSAVPLPTPPPLDRNTRVYLRGGTVLKGEEAGEWLTKEQDRLRSAATTALLTQSGIALLVVGGVAAGFGWLIAGRVLAPLHRVTDTARRIANAPAADRGLHERIALSGPHDEVKDLADTFDTMIERLDRSFDGQRRFVANASHELRTPLTLGRALVEVAMHRRTASEDVRRLGENLLEINDRHERLIGGLLMLASSENALTERAPVDLADVVEHVVAQTGAEARAAGVGIRSTADEALTTGDALLLERLVHNLVENAVRHNTGPGGRIEIVSGPVPEEDGTAGTRVGVTVANTGPVIPAYEIPSLFEPFRRRGTDRLVTAKGAGLGLSIVRSIARAHDGEVTAHPREEGGLSISVTLPAADPLRTLTDLSVRI
ncbi:sensor histidine kinase [Streptomyces uncialis]|uniref:sensor histidine kinase n=1 Tax=Streptomyces uncialis TaxID=1048205 RepID=UPI0037993E71